MAVAVGVEDDAAPLRRRGGMARELLARVGAGMRQPALVGAVWADHVQIPRTVAVRVEQNPLAVGRPRRMRVVAPAPGHPALSRAVHPDDVELRVSLPLTLENEAP